MPSIGLVTLWLLLHLLIHEAGHALAALAVGSRIKRIGLNRLGVYIVRAPAATGFRNALVALAGPGANIFTWAVMASLHMDGALAPLVFGIANLLPFPHSDLRQAIDYMRSKRWPTFAAPWRKRQPCWFPEGQHYERSTALSIKAAWRRLIEWALHQKQPQPGPMKIESRANFNRPQPRPWESNPIEEAEFLEAGIVDPDLPRIVNPRLGLECRLRRGSDGYLSTLFDQISGEAIERSTHFFSDLHAAVLASMRRVGIRDAEIDPIEMAELERVGIRLRSTKYVAPPAAISPALGALLSSRHKDRTSSSRSSRVN